MFGICDQSSTSRSKKKYVIRKTSQEVLKEFGFKIGEVLDEGSYSKVKAATYKENNIAVKIITREHVTKDFNEKFLHREIETLSFVKHENIIKVIKIFDFPKKVYLFMERIERGTLLTLIVTNGPLTEEVTCEYLQQLVNGLLYLHKLDVAHRDVKCENIMITENNIIKLIDFGFCRSVINKMGKRELSDTFCGSRAYASPEVLQGIPYNPKMHDVWSLGCVSYIMLTASWPFDDSNASRMLRCQLSKKIDYSPRRDMRPLSRSVKDLLNQMLEPDVLIRATLERVKRHDWMQKSASHQIVIRDHASDVTSKKSNDG